MKSIFIFGLLAALLLAAGASVYYLYGYKDSFWIQGSAYLLIIFGWLFVLFMVAILHPPKPQKEHAGNVTWQRIKSRLYFIVYPMWLVALVASFVGVDMAKDKRVDTILAQPDAVHATATVTGIEERRLRNTTHVYALIEYTSSTGRVQQAIKDDAGLYKQGQQVPILYAPEHPDMFRILP